MITPTLEKKAANFNLIFRNKKCKKEILSYIIMVHLFIFNLLNFSFYHDTQLVIHSELSIHEKLFIVICNI